MHVNQKIKRLKEKIAQIQKIDPRKEFTKKEMQERRRKADQDIMRYNSKQIEAARRNIQAQKAVIESAVIKKQQKEAPKIVDEANLQKQPIKPIEPSQQRSQKAGGSAGKVRKAVTSFSRSHGIFSQPNQMRRNQILNKTATQPQLDVIQQKGGDKIYINKSMVQIRKQIENQSRNNCSNKQDKRVQYLHKNQKTELEIKNQKEIALQSLSSNLQPGPKVKVPSIFKNSPRYPANFVTQDYKTLPAKQSLQLQRDNQNGFLKNQDYPQRKMFASGNIPDQISGKMSQTPLQSKIFTILQPQKYSKAEKSEAKQTPYKKVNLVMKNELLEDTPFPKENNMAANCLKRYQSSSSSNVFSVPQSNVHIFNNPQPGQNIQIQKTVQNSSNIFNSAAPATNIFKNNSANIFNHQKQAFPSTKLQQPTQKKQNILQNISTGVSNNGGTSKQDSSLNIIKPNNNIFAVQNPQNNKRLQAQKQQDIFKQPNIFKSSRNAESSNIFKQNMPNNTNEETKNTPNIFSQNTQIKIFCQAQVNTVQNKKTLDFESITNKLQQKEEQDAQSSQIYEDQEEIIDMDLADPQKSHMHHQYDKSEILFKELACKFKVEGKLYQNQYISIQKIPQRQQLYVFVKSKIFQIIYSGRVIKQSQALPLKGAYLNIQLKCLLNCEPKAEKLQLASFQTIRIQFKNEDLGKRFVEIINNSLQN